VNSARKTRKFQKEPIREVKDPYPEIAVKGDTPHQKDRETPKEDSLRLVPDRGMVMAGVTDLIRRLTSTAVRLRREGKGAFLDVKPRGAYIYVRVTTNTGESDTVFAPKRQNYVIVKNEGASDGPFSGMVRGQVLSESTVLSRIRQHVKQFIPERTARRERIARRVES